MAVLCSGRQPGDTESIYIINTINELEVDRAALAGLDAESFNSVAFDSTGQYVYAAAYNSNRIAVYNLRTYALSYVESKGVNAIESKATGPTKLVTRRTAASWL